jgi:hypothetical protein
MSLDPFVKSSPLLFWNVSGSLNGGTFLVMGYFTSATFTFWKI